MNKNWIIGLLLICLGFAPIQLRAQNFTNADRYFSPNLDGVKDFLEIPFSIKEENLQKWSLTIAKKQGSSFKKVMGYSSINPKEESLTFTKFFSRIVAKDTPLKAPNSYLWEGRDDNGKLVEDGIYYFTITAIDKWGNESRSPLIPIVVDIVAPKSVVSLESDIFSPNGDGRKENLPIKVTSQDFSKLDTWTITIMDGRGNVVKHFTSDKGDDTVVWDGRKDNREEAAQGNYTLLVTAEDLAGNRTVGEKMKITLVRDYEQIGLEISQTVFSPNRDGYFDNVSFETSLSSLHGMEKWSLEIKNADGESVKDFGDAPFSKVIFYEGLDNKGKVLPDGVYSSELRAWFRSGNQPSSTPVTFRIDTVPPAISVKLKNKILNPNAVGGGFKDLTVLQSFPDNETNTYQISILKPNGDPVLRKTYTSLPPPREFVWNGRDDAGRVLTGKYVYELKAKDEVANIAVAVSDPFEVIDDNLNVEVILDSTSFSPNGDGKLDTINFTFKVNKQYQNILTKGELTILNEQQKPVKVYSFANFPSSLTWDGLEEADVQNNQSDQGAKKLLPDGVYYYTFKAKFETMEEVDLAPEKIYLDTTPIEIDLLPHDLVFSPNGDGNKDQIYFSNHYRTSQLRPETDQFTVVIGKLEGDKTTVYRTREWKGDMPPDLLWTGKDQLKEDSPEGLYQLKIETVDHARNSKTYLSKPFNLVRELEEIALQANPRVVSSLPEGSPNSITLTPSLSSTIGLQKIVYSLFLTNEKKIPFAEMKVPDPLEFNVIPPKSASPWKSGFYYIQATAVFDSGNQPESSPQEIFIDNNPPAASVNAQPLFFSPDDDGVNDELSIRIIAEDNHRVEKVSAAVFRLEEEISKKQKARAQDNYEYHNQKQIPLKTWNWDNGSGKFDKQFNWNGKGDLGELVESATDYVLFVEAKDEVGLSVIVQHEFLVDILVERLSDGRLKIILKSINFKYNSDQMLGNYEKVLGLLIRMLRKFPEYKIHIVGHTDSRGSDKYNDSLSVKRALRVLNYLVNKGGLQKERLTHEGKGKRELLIPEEKKVDPQFTGETREKIIEDNYRKNRRVEFFLKKEE